MAESLNVSAANRIFVDFIARRPILAILLGLLCAGAVLPGLGMLKADFTHTGFFWEDDPKLLRFEAFERRFGNDDVVLVAVHSPSGVFDMETATLVQSLTTELWQVPEIIRVDSIANFNWVHAQGDDIAIESLLPTALTPEILRQRESIALNHKTLTNWLVSKDGTTALISARVKPGIDRAPDAHAIVTAARAIIAKAKVGDEKLYLGGGPSMTYAFEEITTADVSRLIPLAIGLSAVFLAVLLRSLAGTLLPFVVVILSTLMAFGFAGLTGRVQTAMSTSVPSILIAVGIADTLHILITFLAARRSGMSRHDAAHHTLTKNLLATFLTSLTTAVGFFSFVSANLKPISTLGVMAGFGSLAAWVMAQLVVGGLLFVLPINPKPLPPERVRRDEERATRLVDMIARRRWLIIGGTGLASLAALIFSLGVEVNSDPVKYFREGVSVRVTNDFLQETMGNSRAVELVVDSGHEEGAKDPEFLKKVDALQTWLEAQPNITKAVSILDVLKQTHQSLNGDDPASYALANDKETIAQELLLYTMGLPQGMDVNDRITVTNDAIRMTVFNTLNDSRTAVAAAQAIEDKGRELGLVVEATGKYYLYQQTNDYVVGTFLSSIWSASLLIGLIMAIFLRSWKLGLISMIPNVVPLFGGGVLLRLVGQPLDMGTVLVCSVCLGISVDDTSHVLANFAYLRRGGLSRNEAMRQVMTHTGPALLSTNGILITSFASFATASFVPNVYFGVLTAFILSLALVADLFFTPAMLVESPARGMKLVPSADLETSAASQ